jgi:SIR2-like domain
MTHILLTGAGFTRNWGGWLAKELEGDLLARLARHEQLRRLVQNSENYEEALGKARSPGYSGVPVSAEQVKILEEAIKESFWAMNLALGQRASMYPSGESKRSIVEFLPKFDAIFTLNQDLLLEFHYNAGHPPSRWIGSYYPGIEPEVFTPLKAREVVRVERRVGSIRAEDSRRQPVYKLHGSVDWVDGSGSLFVMGGGKDAYIQSKPLLRQYFEIFTDYLRRPDARLMIIGYGFADEHLNRVLVEAAQANPSLGVFHVHPEGRDAVHRGARERVAIYMPPSTASLPCIGESRRPLTATFGGDTLEFDKLMRFFG